MRRVVILLAVAALVAGCSSSTDGHPVAVKHRSTNSDPRSSSSRGAGSPATGSPDPHHACHGTVVGHDRPYDVELCSAIAIPGVRYHTELQHYHLSGTIHYNTSPPVGGNHSPLWANCTGTVYTQPVANENAVHMLEHGAVWITYDPQSLSPSEVAALASYVHGVDYTALSPYPGLKAPISLQAWGYQLFVNDPNDPRIAEFLALLRHNPRTTPEPNVLCSDPYFDPSQSHPGHPQE